MRTDYIESNIEEDIELKNQFGIRNSLDPITFREASSKLCADKNSNDPCIIKNTTQVESNDKYLENVSFVEVNSFPAVSQQLSLKHNVDDAIDKISIVRNYQDNDFNNYNIINIISITLNTQAIKGNQRITESYKDHFHQKMNVL